MTEAAAIAPPIKSQFYLCTQVREGVRCTGALARTGETALRCEVCGKEYLIFRGIPVLRETTLAELEREGGYDHRDRQKELAEGIYAEYREFLTRWIKKLNLTGPTLDVGCGNGLLADALPDYVGMEYSITGLLNRGWRGEERVCGDAQRLPFKSAAFEVLTSVNVFEHIPRVDLVYAEIDRVLKPGGVMLLKPAWSSLRAYTELIPIRKYSELNLRQKWVKFFLPVIMSKPYKLFARIPKRIVRRMFSRGPRPMKWTPLVPCSYPDGKYTQEQWLPDTDAAASIDIHETIMYFVRRGYECISHPKVMRQILAGHDWVILRKAKPVS